MPRYFFNFRDAKGLSPDEEGLDFPDLETVEQEALRALGQLAKDSLSSEPGDMAVEVVDAQGNSALVASLTLRIKRSTS